MRTFPSTDGVFAAFAERQFESLDEYSPEAFEQLLRRVFPRASVRPCELAFAQETVWYVYREGRWVSWRVPAWWRDRSLPRFLVDRDGFIVESNTPPERANSIGGLIGRHVLDFAVDGSFAELLHVMGEPGGPREWTSTIQYVLGGSVRVAEIHVERPDEGPAEIVVRPAPVAPFMGLPPATLRPELTCLPPRDRLFAAFVHVVLDRIAEPTPRGLEIRLRRLYPGATVAVDDDETPDATPTWVCRRDDRDPLPDGWWREPGLPSVVLEASSRIVSASPDLEAMLGGPLAGRSWQELTGTAGVPDADMATAVLFELGETETAYLGLDPDGVEHAFDAWVTASGDRLIAVLRPR